MERIIFVADAVSEISTGASFASEFNIIPIGFANVITVDDIQAAHRLVISAHATISNSDSNNDFALESSNLLLPDEEALVQSLKEAKAAYVVTGEASKIMSKVEDLLR